MQKRLLVLSAYGSRLLCIMAAKVCCQLTIFVADALCLLPTPESPEAPLSVAYIARRHSWHLLGEERCFQVGYSAFLCIQFLSIIFLATNFIHTFCEHCERSYPIIITVFLDIILISISLFRFFIGSFRHSAVDVR